MQSARIILTAGLARLAGLSRSQLHALRTGRATPQPRTLHRLEQAAQARLCQTLAQLGAQPALDLPLPALATLTATTVAAVRAQVQAQLAARARHTPGRALARQLGVPPPTLARYLTAGLPAALPPARLATLARRLRRLPAPPRRTAATRRTPATRAAGEEDG
jgi:hypothetical protein